MLMSVYNNLLFVGPSQHFIGSMRWLNLGQGKKNLGEGRLCMKIGVMF